MKYTKLGVTLVVLLSAILWSVRCYPITNEEEHLIDKDEKRYPNGTVIGKYIYNDNEGNPIHVRYYADDASYGVELKRVKVVNSEQTGTEKISKYPLQLTETPFETALDPFFDLKDLKNFSNDPGQSYKDKVKNDLKSNVEFEILLQNELKAPEKCGKEKVKVYFDKDKRKTRDAPINYGSLNYCNRI